MSIYNIGDPACPLPDELILDASLLLELRIPRSTPPSLRHQAATQFLTRIRNEGTASRLLLLASALTLEECYFKIINSAFEELIAQPNFSPQYKRWHDLYKDQPQLIQQFMPALEKFRSAVLALSVLVIEPEDLGDPPPSIEPQMLLHIGAAFILPKDAYILAIADRLAVPHIATLDADFLRADLNKFAIYTYP